MKIILARSIISRALGLMFKRDFDDVLVLVMPYESRINGIHTCFMRFPIDVYFLDSKGNLVDKAKNVKPWKLGVYPKKPAKYIIEVKAGKRLDLAGIKRKLANL